MRISSALKSVRYDSLAGHATRLAHVLVAACRAALLSPATLKAETIFLGPTPYLSGTDSPLDLSGLGTTFFLKDSKDGELKAPGIFQPLDPATHAFVLSPSALADSDETFGDQEINGQTGEARSAGVVSDVHTQPVVM